MALGRNPSIPIVSGGGGGDAVVVSDDSLYIGRFYSGGGLATSNGTPLTLTDSSGLDSVDDGSLTGVSWNAANDRWDISTAGLYVIHSQVSFASAASGTARCQTLWGDDFKVQRARTLPVPFTGAALDLWFQVTARFDAGDQAGGIQVRQDSGGALNMTYAEQYVTRILEF